MHFLHITPEDIQKHPWLGVLIGFIGIALFTFVSYTATKDYLAFSNQKAPELFDMEKFESGSPFTKKWVTVTNFHLNCEIVEKTQRTDPLERLIESPVYDTYTVITDSVGSELIIVQFHGDVFCSDYKNRPLTGILTKTDDYSYGFGFSNTKLSKTTHARLILRVDEGLRSAVGILAIGFVFDIASLLLVLYASRLWLEKLGNPFWAGFLKLIMLLTHIMSGKTKTG